MLRSVLVSIQRHPVVWFFVLTFTFSWSLALLLIARYQGILSVPTWIHYLIAGGPTLAALLVTGITGGRPALAELLARLGRWRIGWRAWLVAVGSPLALAASATLISVLLTGAWPDLHTLGQITYLGDVGFVPALLIWILTFGFGEEIGWRGFALERLQRGQHSLRAALVIGSFWALWHLPQFFYHANFLALGLGGFFGFALSVLTGSILLTWIYNYCRASILAVALWHGLFDFFTATQAAQGMIAMLMSVIIIPWALLIMVGLLRRPADPAQDTPAAAQPTPR